MINLGEIPPHLKSQIDEMSSILSPYTKRAYFVGGFVRDLYLQNPIKDIDIEVYDVASDDFDVLMQSIGALGVGKSFFVYKYKDLDIALPRVERKISQGHSGFEVKLTQDEKEASKRRDFSMNSIMVNIFTHDIHDFWGGVECIEKKLIKHIDEQAFREDSLRVLRAVQFAARFDFSIDKKTLHVMQNIDLNDLSKNRIFWEFEKLFKAKYLHVGLYYLYELGLFEKIFSLHVSLEQVEKIAKELEDAHFEEELREYYLIYIVCGVLGVGYEAVLKHLEVPNRYYTIFKYQPFFSSLLSENELLHVAMHMPIKKWLGNYRDGIKEMAKKLNIYEEIYTGGIDIQDVIKDGYQKEEIKKEYTRRVLKTILSYKES